MITHKIQKWGHSDLSLGKPYSIHLRCPQIWYGALRPIGLKTISLYRWIPIDFYWKCLLLLWAWQKSNWSVWIMLGKSSVDVSTHMIKNFQTQRWQFVPLSKFQMWKLFMILVTLKTKSCSNLWYAIEDLAIMHVGYKYQVSSLIGYWFVGICLSHWL